MKLVCVAILFIFVVRITAYATLNIIMSLFWGILSQSPDNSGIVYLTEYLVPYVCGVGAMVYLLTYLWRCAVRPFFTTDICADTDAGVNTSTSYGDNVNKMLTDSSGKFCNLKRGLRFMLSMVVIYSFLVIAHHIFTGYQMLIENNPNSGIVLKERLIPDLVCCGSFIFCLIQLWRRNA